MTPRSHHQSRLLSLSLLCLLSSLILACGAPPMGEALSSGPRWACPSPTPLPYGEAGPVKESRVVATANPTTGEGETTEDTYFAAWEQEYGPHGTLLGGQPATTHPPFPSPTPYGRTGNTYILGQRVEVAPLHVLVTAQVGPAVDTDRQMYFVDLQWINMTSTAVPFMAGQVWLRTITRADGSQQSGEGWGVSGEQAKALGLTLPSVVPPGESTMRFPIVAPKGTPQVVELRMVTKPQTLSTPNPSGTRTTPLPTPIAQPTPTLNTALRNPYGELLVIQWVNAPMAGPPCDSAGVLTDWSEAGDSKAIPRDAAINVQAPPGAARVAQIVMAQIGKPYVWGAAGPNAFDCSGLMLWSYAQVGIRIPRVANDQYRALRPLPYSQSVSGALMYMDTLHGTFQTATHAAMIIDVNGDGKWDIVHALSPKYGIRADLDVFQSAYWRKQMFPEGRIP